LSCFIKVNDVHFSYTGLPEDEVLKGISLEISRGEYIALIGQNGGGKTTLAKHFNGVCKPTSGEVIVDGMNTRDLSVADLAPKVGYCYQNPDHQILHDTVEKEVAFGPRNLGLPENEVRERVTEALSAVGLLEYRQEHPYFAGKGERQKIAVASIIAMRPAVLVLDEPTTGLDWTGSQGMMSLIDKLWEHGHTVIIITHDMRLVAEHARRVIVISEGRIIADDATHVIFSEKRQELSAARLSPPQITRLGWVIYGDSTGWLTVSEAADFAIERMAVADSQE
jgi:energy-coupling factor transport system ATP-binding protein